MPPPLSNGDWILSGNINYPFEASNSYAEGNAWSASAAFTRQRLAQIAEMEEEIKVLRGYDADNSCHSACCMDRTLGRLESILADLRHGMRTKGASE